MYILQEQHNLVGAVIDPDNKYIYYLKTTRKMRVKYRFTERTDMVMNENLLSVAAEEYVCICICSRETKHSPNLILSILSMSLS